MTFRHLQPGTINSTKLIAFVLMAFGILAFAYQGIGYTAAENVVAPTIVRLR